MANAVEDFGVEKLVKQTGDIILGINGQSTENFNTHEEICEKVKSCRSQLRMVVVNTDICIRIELERRKQKLQSILRAKQYELTSLEKRRRAVLFRAQERSKRTQTAVRKTSSQQLPPDGGDTRSLSGFSMSSTDDTLSCSSLTFSNDSASASASTTNSPVVMRSRAATSILSNTTRSLADIMAVQLQQRRRSASITVNELELSLPKSETDCQVLESDNHTNNENAQECSRL